MPVGPRGTMFEIAASAADGFAASAAEPTPTPATCTSTTPIAPIGPIVPIEPIVPTAPTTSRTPTGRPAPRIRRDREPPHACSGHRPPQRRRPPRCAPRRQPL